MTEVQYLMIVGTIWVAPRCGVLGSLIGVVILFIACLKGLGVMQ